MDESEPVLMSFLGNELTRYFPPKKNIVLVIVL